MTRVSRERRSIDADSQRSENFVFVILYVNNFMFMLDWYFHTKHSVHGHNFLKVSSLRFSITPDLFGASSLNIFFSAAIRFELENFNFVI